MYNYNNDELYHYGVKGMKWGVRRAREVYISGLERKRKHDKYAYDRDRIQDKLSNPTRKDGPISSSKKQKESIAKRKTFERNDAETAYKIAKAKAKNDPNYKNSDEYKSAINEYGRTKAMEAIDNLLSIDNHMRR